MVTAENDIKSLNKYLEGIYMAIDSFEHYVSMAKSSENESLLNDIKIQYKSSASEVINKIMDLGGKSKDEASLLGKFSETFLNIKDKITIQNDEQLLSEAYKSIETGLKMGNKFLNENELTTSSRELIANDLKKQNALLDIFPSKIPLKK